MEENGNGILGNVLNALVEKGMDNDRMFGGGNGIWIIFFLFMTFMFNGGNFGFNGWGRNNISNTDLATKQDLGATAAWQATQNDIHTVNGNIDRVDQNLNNLGYNTLAQMNNLNQNVSQQGYNTSIEILRQGNETQKAVMQNGNGTQMAIMQGNNDTQRAVMGTGANLAMAITNGNNETQRTIMGTGSNLAMAITNGNNDTQRTIMQGDYATQTAIMQGNNDTQRTILIGDNNIQSTLQKNNGDAQLAICQATNSVQNSINNNGNNLAAAIRETASSTLQGITSLGFLTQQKGDEIRSELYKSTCAITTNDTANTQKILDKLCMMEQNQQAQRIQELTVANQSLQLQNQVKELQAGQIAGAGYIINSIRPYPVPAYTVSSPYGTGTTTPTTGA